MMIQPVKQNNQFKLSLKMILKRGGEVKYESLLERKLRNNSVGNTWKYFKDGVVVIAGDLFEKQEDLTDDKIWKDAGKYFYKFFYF